MTIQAKGASHRSGYVPFSPPRTTTKPTPPPPAPPPLMHTADVVFKLRQYTGLSEEQVSWVLRITYEEYCFWISGQKPAPHEENHLRSVFDVIKRIDRGWNEDLEPLLCRERDGKVPMEMLRAGEYEQVVKLLGSGPGRVEFPPSPEDKTRRPPPPYELIGALHDPILPNCGRVVATFPIPAANRK